jgi:hypothetical protein
MESNTVDSNRNAPTKRALATTMIKIVDAKENMGTANTKIVESSAST